MKTKTKKLKRKCVILLTLALAFIAIFPHTACREPETPEPQVCYRRIVVWLTNEASLQVARDSYIPTITFNTENIDLFSGYFPLSFTRDIRGEGLREGTATDLIVVGRTLRGEHVPIPQTEEFINGFQFSIEIRLFRPKDRPLERNDIIDTVEIFRTKRSVCRILYLEMLSPCTCPPDLI